MSRTRSVIANAAGSGVARLVNLAVSVAFVPLAMAHLGRDGYAMVAVMISASLIAAYGDLGLGATLVNSIAEARSNGGKRRCAARMVTNVVILLLCIAGVGVASAGVLLSIGKIGWSSATAITLVAMNIPAAVYQRVLFAVERSTEAWAWQSGGRALGLVGVWLWGVVSVADVEHFVAGLFGVPLVVNVVASVVVWRSDVGAWMSPKKRYFSMKVLKNALPLGLAFLTLQSTIFFEVGMDSALIAIVLGVDSVTAYDVHARLFMYVPALLSLVILPIWPAIANAREAGDSEWVARTRRLSYVIVGLVAVSASAVLVAFASPIVAQWAGHSLAVAPALLAGLAVYVVVACIASLQSVLLNGEGRIVEQASVTAPYLLALLVLKVGALVTIGLTAMVWVTVLLIAIRFAVTALLERRWKGVGGTLGANA